MELSASTKMFQERMKRKGFSCNPVELPQGTRTSEDAARAVGCSLKQIAKSILFRGRITGKPVLVVASGSNRIDEKKVGSIFGEPVEKADADFVKESTGFSIGGVPPSCHIKKIPTLIDEELLSQSEIWAAAGNPNSVFRLTPNELLKITEGKVADVKVCS
ncbi:MAG: YbaK/EbsC family protein [Candidatus Aenigmatarchaeota archaeon]